MNGFGSVKNTVKDLRLLNRSNKWRCGIFLYSFPLQTEKIFDNMFLFNNTAAAFLILFMKPSRSYDIILIECGICLDRSQHSKNP